jgi:hypothetical protein
VSGRILIDYFGYHKHHEGLVRKEIGGPPPPPPPPFSSRPRLPRAPSQHIEYNEDGTVREKKNEGPAYVKRLSEEKQKQNVEEMLRRVDDLIFVSPMLEGFSLKGKLWCKSSSYLS